MKDIGFRKEITTGCYLDHFDGFQEKNFLLKYAMMKSPVYLPAFYLTACVRTKKPDLDCYLENRRNRYALFVPVFLKNDS